MNEENIKSPTEKITQLVPETYQMFLLVGISIIGYAICMIYAMKKDYLIVIIGCLICILPLLPLAMIRKNGKIQFIRSNK